MERKRPSKGEINLILEDAFKKNPGPWVKHSYIVGEIAEKIGKDLGLDKEFAYACGCLHDIGRINGFSYIKHILDGYRILEREYPDISKICLTHSFPLKDIETYLGEIDVSEEDYEFIRKYINECTYDDYDLLIQLLDSMVMGEGACLQEKRMIDVILRYGVNEYTVDNIKRQIEIKEYFEDRLNKSIYLYMEDVSKNTFGF